MWGWGGAYVTRAAGNRVERTTNTGLTMGARKEGEATTAVGGRGKRARLMLA